MKKHQLVLLVSLISLNAVAGPREKAWKLHNRLAGVPPVKTTNQDPDLADPLKAMTDAISQNRPEDAAEIATKHPNFYNVVLKNWIKPWTNREQTPRIELNDYVATIIGMIRDDVPFNQVLSGDILYTVNGVTAVYSNTDNNHYRDAERANINLMNNLMRQTQSAVTGMPATAVAGVITTRASGESFFSAGTNRRVNRFNFINYMCRDYEALHDVNIPDYRVRRDVERNPGGDSRTYKSKCVGCHAGQDALGGAYAYYDFVNGRLVYSPMVVVTKMNHNVYYKDGYVTTDDSWINTWASGQNAALGWRGATSGNGVKQLGEMFTRSKAFSQCMAKKVFQLVCLKEAINTDDVEMVNSLADQFEQNNYNMKDLIINTSVGCIVNEDE